MSRAKVVLAAATVGGAGTKTALRSAARGLANSGVQALIVSPARYSAGDLGEVEIGGVELGEVEIAPRSRWIALLGELLGYPRASIYIGFADRLPLLSRAGKQQVMVIQNPHLYNNTGRDDNNIGPDGASNWVGDNRIKHAVLSRWARWSVNKADIIICSTEASRDEVLTATGAKPEIVVVRPIPIAQPGSTKESHSEQVSKVLLVGDIYEYKKVDVAIAAIAGFGSKMSREMEVVHLGRVIEEQAGRSAREAAERAREAGVVVKFRGAVDHAEVMAAMVAADVLLLCSTTESQGLPLAEAMTVGLPVICRDLAVFVEQGGLGVVAVAGNSSDPEVDIQAFARGIETLDSAGARSRMTGTAKALMNTGQVSINMGWNLLP